MERYCLDVSKQLMFLRVDLFARGVAGTFCEGKVQETFAQKYEDCVKCDFYQMVQKLIVTTSAIFLAFMHYFLHFLDALYKVRE